MKTDPGKPSTWVPFEISMCKGCWAGCCTLPVEVTAEELYHMGLIKIEEVQGRLKPIATRLKKEGVIQDFHPRRAVFILKQKPNGDCQFLDKNRLCKIYSVRPSICRRFPDGGPRPGYCPHREKKNG